MGRSEAVDSALYYIPFISAPISLFSSLYMVFLILRKGKGSYFKPREQLLLGLSFLDICGSLGLSFSTTPGPEAVNEYLPTYGTIATCSAQGFFVQLGVGAPLYNASICVYYILSVRYSYKDDQLRKWVIPSMHCVNLTFIFGTAIASLFMKLFNFAGTLGCWIHQPHKYLCTADPRYCARGVGADDFIVYFGLLHLTLCFVFVVVAMGFLYCTVRRIEARSLRWQFEDASVGNNMQPTPLSQRTLETGVLYSASFVFVYLPTVLVGAVPYFDTKKDQPLYISLLIAIVVLLPLQGFFNMLIYTSPMWLPWIHDLKLCFSWPAVKKGRSQMTPDPTPDLESFQLTDSQAESSVVENDNDNEGSRGAAVENLNEVRRGSVKQASMAEEVTRAELLGSSAFFQVP